MNGKLSLIKAKEEQNDMWGLIYRMKKRVGKKKSRGKKFSEAAKKISTV